MKMRRVMVCALLAHWILAVGCTQAVDGHEAHSHKPDSHEAAQGDEKHLPPNHLSPNKPLARVIPQGPGTPAQRRSTTRELYADAWQAQQSHRFAEALILVEQALQQSPRVGELWLLQANLNRLLGMNIQAAQSCRAAAGLIGPLPTLLCQHQVADKLASVDAHNALKKVERLMQLPGALPPEATFAAWVYGAAAELAVDAQVLERARFYSRLAYAKNPSIQNRVLLAKALSAQGNHTAALALLPIGASQDPAITVNRLVILQQVAGTEGQLARESAILNSQFQQALVAGDLVHGREMALFYLDVLDRPEIALKVAEANWLNQKASDDEELLLRARAKTLNTLGISPVSAEGTHIGV